MSIEESLIRRQLFNQRYANGLSKDTIDQLKRIYSQVNERLLLETTDVQLLRLSNMQDDIRAILNNEMVDFNSDLISNLNDFIEDDLRFNYAVISGDTDVILSMPILEQVQRNALASEMGVGVGASTLNVNEAIIAFSSRKSKDVLQVISDGILTGETNASMANKIQKLSDSQHKNQAVTLVRTAVAKVSGVAIEDVAKQNSEIMKGMEWVATLDSNTTLICAGRDGNIYPIGKTPSYPAHWGERSRLIPRISDEFNIDRSRVKRPQIGSDGRGTTSSNTKFDSFLKRQDAEYQDEYFSKFPDGKEKAALFRRGGLEIQQFRDELGHNYTLEELRALEPLAFKKANLSDDIFDNQP
jgi:SPP1 gp7 family putative phage head morphogenesis protein